MTTRPPFAFHSVPAFALAMFTLLTMLAPAHAQTLSVLHSFTGGGDGEYPYAGVTLDRQGRIYGTAYDGSHGDGVAYRVVREGGGWILSPIYSFGSQEQDGVYPESRMLFGPDGLLYGTTYRGGAHGYGTVYSLRPTATACTAAICPWLETILYSFSGQDGLEPQAGDLAFDQAGNIYGTTSGGGSSNQGVVFKLTRSGNGWTESVLWSFDCRSGGCQPSTGVIFDSAGNLYGTTSSGGSAGNGTVYELSPTQSRWSGTTLYTFTGENGVGGGGLTMDTHGNLFGVTSPVGASQDVAAYELSQQNGSWSFTLLHDFGIVGGTYAAPAFDAQGNLYGTLTGFGGGGNDIGAIFKLTPSGNQWIYSPFYQFVCTDGCAPTGAVTFDSSGNMYGVTDEGGRDVDGVVWQITP